MGYKLNLIALFVLLFHMNRVQEMRMLLTSVLSIKSLNMKSFGDLSASSAIAKAYFWTSRRLYATIEGGKDLVDLAKTISSKFPREKQNMEIYPDPSGDPCVFVIRTRTPVFLLLPESKLSGVVLFMHLNLH
ncbi:hypothetical protein TB2_033692 [Malus domestica]